MSYEPRTIAFLAEVIHPPKPPDSAKVQAIHNRLFQQPEFAYQNFQVAADGIHLTNPGQTPGSVSAASFMQDRVILREEFRPGTVEEFATRVVNVTSIAFEQLGIEQSIAQQFVVRSLINPRSATDSRSFVADRLVAGGAASLQSFGRPLQTLGLRFSFPSPQPPHEVFHLRIEPWVQEPRSLWLECAGSYTRSLPRNQLGDLSNGLWSTYRFLTGPALEWLARFDESEGV